MARLATLIFALAALLAFVALPVMGAPAADEDADTWAEEKKKIDQQVQDWWKAHNKHVHDIAHKHKHKHHSHTHAAPSHSLSFDPRPTPLSVKHVPSPKPNDSAPASVSKASSSSSAAPVSTPKVSQGQYLGPHNKARAAHGAKPLKWSDSLAAKAQSWANKCKFQHSGPGENLAAGTGNDFDFKDAMQLWMNEADEYNPSNPKPLHFTQVVWQSTTEVGCAVAICDGIFPAKYGKARYFVCEYNTPGNVLGEFAENVQV
jgi:uncharacterized protein YkwD